MVDNQKVGIPWSSNRSPVRSRREVLVNEKNFAILALTILAVSEFAFCYATSQQTQNIGVIVTGLVAMIGTTIQK